MHLTHSVTLPHWRSVVRHALPNIAIGKLIPSAIFVVALELAGTESAILTALIWSLGAIAYRLGKGKAVPGLLWLTTIALVSRTILALATGSSMAYFLQPTISTCLVALAFIVTAPLATPLFERLTMDFCPLDDQTRSHPLIRRFFRWATLWWGLTSLANFSITLWLLLTQSTTTFVLVKSMLGPITTTITLGVAFLGFRFTLKRGGIDLVFAEPTQAEPHKVLQASIPTG